MENAPVPSHFCDMRCFILDETGRLVESDPTFLITNGSGTTRSDDGSCDVAVVFAPVTAGRNILTAIAPNVQTQPAPPRCAMCGK